MNSRLPRSTNASPPPSREKALGSGTNSTRTPVALEKFWTIKSSLWLPTGATNEKDVQIAKDVEDPPIMPEGLPSNSIVASLSEAHLPRIVSELPEVVNVSR
jgi:hypothetical protein